MEQENQEFKGSWNYIDNSKSGYASWEPVYKTPNPQKNFLSKNFKCIEFKKMGMEVK